MPLDGVRLLIERYRCVYRWYFQDGPQYSHVETKTLRGHYIMYREVFYVKIITT